MSLLFLPASYTPPLTNVTVGSALCPCYFSQPPIPPADKCDCRQCPMSLLFLPASYTPPLTNVTVGSALCPCYFSQPPIPPADKCDCRQCPMPLLFLLASYTPADKCDCRQCPMPLLFSKPPIPPLTNDPGTIQRGRNSVSAISGLQSGHVVSVCPVSTIKLNHFTPPLSAEGVMATALENSSCG